MALFKKNETKNVSSTKGVKGGYIFVAPPGTTLPTDIKTNLAEAFLNLGFISEDGYTESEETDANELKDMNGDLMDSATTSRVSPRSSRSQRSRRRPSRSCTAPTT